MLPLVLKSKVDYQLEPGFFVGWFFVVLGYCVVVLVGFVLVVEGFVFCVFFWLIFASF